MDNSFFVNQESANDCGAACLTMILRLFGKRINLAEVKENLSFQQDGTSAYEIINLSRKYGLMAEGYKNYDLKNAAFPFIAHVITEGNLQHFVVVIRVTKNKILVADPASRVTYVNLSDFTERYTGIAITFKTLEKDFLEVDKIETIKIFFLSIVLSLLTITSSYFLTNTLKSVSENPKVSNCIFMLLCLLFLLLTKELVNYHTKIKALEFETETDRLLTIPVINKLINLPYKKYRRDGTGALMSKLNDLSYVKEMLYVVVESLLVSFVLIIGIMFVFVLYNFWMFLINLLIIVIFILVNYSFYKNNFYDTYLIQAKNEALAGKITDVLFNVITVKSLVKERYFYEGLTDEYESIINKYKQVSLLSDKKDLFLSVMLSFSIALIIFVLFLSKHKIYDLIFIVWLENILFEALEAFLRVQPLYFNFKSAFTRIKSLEGEPKTNFKRILINSFYFHNVSFKYGDKLVLKRVSFCVKKGEWVMVKGPSGSGKSTIFKLLMRQGVEAKKGIYVNAKKLNTFDEMTIRKSITYVEQNAKLFKMSIKDNIYLGKKEVNYVNDLLEHFKLDISMIIDETYSNLSGGQMQIVLMIQALVNGGNVIIFDETTSQLDELKEAFLFTFIKKYFKDKTIILISHKGSNKKYFNKFITLENGQVKEENNEKID